MSELQAVIDATPEGCRHSWHYLGFRPHYTSPFLAPARVPVYRCDACGKVDEGEAVTVKKDYQFRKDAKDAFGWSLLDKPSVQDFGKKENEKL